MFLRPSLKNFFKKFRIAKFCSLLIMNLIKSILSVQIIYHFKQLNSIKKVIQIQRKFNSARILYAQNHLFFQNTNVDHQYFETIYFKYLVSSYHLRLVTACFTSNNISGLPFLVRLVPLAITICALCLNVT